MGFRKTLRLALLIALSGCGSSWDQKADLDAQIELQWFEGRQLVDAVEFFEKGGQYEDSGLPDAPAIDEPTILPLARRLRDELGLEVKAVLDNPQFAFAVIVEVPAEDAKKARVRDVLKEADEEFFGVIMQNWGHRWLSLDFFDSLEMEMLEEAGMLEAVREGNL